ncbi:alpha/beta fold hydrolase [Streptacidiphilus sp. EB129]|uniref:alpha/beta fold hydrolase n=1 Tax=Streptacidiphilus sp. EB129 TaxID=3156262 RepID=UPI0035194189
MSEASSSGAAEAVKQVRAVAGSVVDDVASGRWRRVGLVGVSLGVVAVGAAAGIAAERLTLGREMRRRAGAEIEAAAPFGSLHGTPRTVAAPDGTELYVELDGSGWPETVRSPVPAESGADAPTPGPATAGPWPARGDAEAQAQNRAQAAAQAQPPAQLQAQNRARGQDQARTGPAPAPAGPAPAPAPRAARKGWLGLFRGTAAQTADEAADEAEAGRPAAVEPLPLTVVFCHGYCLSQDSWHFQRAAFRDGLRLVFWDQRSHGRSERSRSHLAGEPAGIDQLGGDLKAVLDAVAPEGPLVLVGHSMGGMTVMALADRYPELIRDRVAAVALFGTTAGSWSGVTLGLPAYGAKVLHRVAPGVLRALGRQRDLVERSRRLGSDLTSVLYRKFSFGSDDVDPAVERFAQRLLEATPIDVVAEFFPAFPQHEKTAALAAFRDIPVLVMAGDRDLLTPPAHSEAIAAELPDAELVIVPETGHLVMLERPALVDAALARLLEQAAGRTGAPLPQSVRDLALGEVLTS